MLPKKSRADRKVIKKIFEAKSTKRQAKSILNSTTLSFRFILNQEEQTPRISFIVPKSISKKAVDRNLLRRRGYRVLEKYITKFPNGISGIIMFKKPQVPTIEIEKDINFFLDRLYENRKN